MLLNYLFSVVITRNTGACLILKKQRGELVQASSPGQELVGRIWGDVEYTVDAGLFQRLGILPGIAAKGAASAASAALEFAAAVANEYQLNLFLETWRIVDIIHGDSPVAEEADVRKRIEIL